MTVGPVYATVQTWRGEPVVVVEWLVDGKQMRVPLLAKNGKRWTKPRTVSKAQMEIATCLLGREPKSQAEAKAALAAPENQKLIAALEGKLDV